MAATNKYEFDVIKITILEIMWFMSQLRFSTSISTLKQCIMEGNVFVVSDRSYIHMFSSSSCAWIITTPDGKEQIKVSGVIPIFC